MKQYIISIDQSTQGTKALLLDHSGRLICRTDKPHQQIVDKNGWVSHDPEQIYRNTIEVIRLLMKKSGVSQDMIAGLGISNQRETSVIWDRDTGESFAPAVVWQCARATEICERENIKKHKEEIFRKTGMNLSPYFPAAKLAWLVENTPGMKEKSEEGRLRCGTMDSYLLYRLTGGESYKTDYSNASRTQLFHIFSLQWDEEICKWFGLDVKNLPEVVDSNALFGYTDCERIFDHPIPIHCVLGDSHAALFGQNCLKAGMTKTTYGTGSSIMMNIGEKAVLSSHGVVTSLAWGIDGKVEYVLEGNLNYTGAVITWMKDEVKLIADSAETCTLANAASKEDELYLIPAFTGLGAPYWNSHVKAAVVGMDRTTGRAELVRAALECIAYQIYDVITAMEEDAGICLEELRVDGGPTKNAYLMQFQSDILRAVVAVSDAEEMSGLGAGYMAGLALGIWDESVFKNQERTCYTPVMIEAVQQQKVKGWKASVSMMLNDAK